MVREYGIVSSDVGLLASNQLTLGSIASGTLAEGPMEAEEKKFNVIWVDPGSCCFALYSKLNPDHVLLKQSPLALAKAIKV